MTALFLVVVAWMLPVPTSARAGSGTVAVRALTVAARLEGYARVEPVAVLAVNSTLAGTVSGLRVLPGETVRKGEVVARLTGPAVVEVLAQRQNAVAGAQAAWAAARKSLDIERRKLAEQLSTRKEVSQAEASLVQAKAFLGDARVRLRTAREAAILKSPVSATVLAISAAEGEQVQQGETILTLQPAGSLWLKARYYGADAAAVRGGMRGRFFPAYGGPAVPVKVRSLIGTVEPDGGRTVGLVATAPPPGWLNGEAGTVVLEGATRTLPAVPTRALVLDGGKWWVLVKTGSITRRQAVVPGPSRGDLTLIERGLSPGAAVVVENAYLEYHRAFSKHYQQPD